MITVTICVVTYNHEKYIDDCIQSILNQVHDFEIEILIHDDASTDGTTNKIKNWQKKYPDLIFPIIQVANQYSIEPIIAPKFLFPKARGVYIAMCEGDDYWISSNKLRDQVEKLEQNPAINLCYHPSKIISRDADPTLQGFNGNREKIVSASEVLTGGGSFIPTAAIMFRATCIKSITEFFTNNSVHVGDVYVQAITAMPHGAIYLPDLRAVYRFEVEGSFSARKNIISLDDRKKTELRYISGIEALSKYGYSKKIIKKYLSRLLTGWAFFFLEKNDLALAREMLAISLRKSSGSNLRKFLLILFLYIPLANNKYLFRLIEIYRKQKRRKERNKH